MPANIQKAGYCGEPARLRRRLADQRRDFWLRQRAGAPAFHRRRIRFVCGDDGGIHAEDAEWLRAGKTRPHIRDDAADVQIVGKTLLMPTSERDAQHVGQIAGTASRIGANFRRTSFAALAAHPESARKREVRRSKKFFTDHRERRASGRDTGDYYRCFSRHRTRTAQRMTDRQLLMRPSLCSWRARNHGKQLSWTWWLLGRILRWKQEHADWTPSSAIAFLRSMPC